MTRDQMLTDLYSRLTSRKLLMALLAIGFAVWSYSDGRLSAVELQASVMAAVTVYSATNAVETIAARGPAATPIVTPEQLDALVDRLLPAVVAGVVARMQAAPATTGQAAP